MSLGNRAIDHAPPRGSVFVPRYEVAPSGHRVAPPETARPGRSLVQAAAWADLALAAAAVLDAFETWEVPGANGYGRLIARFLVAVGAWAVLAWQCGAMRPTALRIRRTLGALGLLSVIARLLISGPFPASAVPRVVVACVVLAFGSAACHIAIRRRAREVCEAHPAWRGCRPEHGAWTRRRIAIVLSSLEWIACGGVETWLGNFWFGQVVMAGGVLGIVLAGDLARPPGLRRLPAPDRRRFTPWAVFPLVAPLLLLRALWLLRAGG